MRISDWSSDVCSSDLLLISDVRLRDSINGVTVAEEVNRRLGTRVIFLTAYPAEALVSGRAWGARFLGKPYSETELRQVIDELLSDGADGEAAPGGRSEEHTSELQSLMRISYAVFCLKKKNKTQRQTNNNTDRL